MILVTGGTGQTGQFVIQELRRRGHAIRVLVRPQSAAQVSEPGVEVALGDLGDRDSLRRAMVDVSGVVHTACTFSDSRIDAARRSGSGSVVGRIMPVTVSACWPVSRRFACESSKPKLGRPSRPTPAPSRK